MKRSVRLKINDKLHDVVTDPSRKLLWVLRTELGLTGTKYGCGEGYCGACTVLVNNDAVRSCQTPLQDVEGKEVVTIEGLEKDGGLSALQHEFVQHDALQCGYCTSGMIMSATSLLKANSRPSRSEILEWMDSNLCRCGAHKRIVEAVEAAAAGTKGGI